MSNIVPQRVGKNHVVWGRLENENRFIVRDTAFDISTVWVVSGPVFNDVNSVTTAAGGIGIPDATYKVISWFDEHDALNVRAYLIEQNDTNTQLSNYLHSVDDVEAMTGLDFFPDLEPAVEGPLEAATFTARRTQPAGLTG